MTSKASRSVLSMKDYKAVLAEASGVAQPYKEELFHDHLRPSFEVESVAKMCGCCVDMILLFFLKPSYNCYIDSSTWFISQ